MPPPSFLRMPAAAALLALAAGGASAASVSAADASLVDTHWRLISIDGMAVAPGDQEAQLVFAGDGSVDGNTGCNAFGGGYTLDGASLSFSHFASTRMFCADLQDQEQAVFDTLPLVAGWQVAGDRLELMNAEGAVVALFEAVADRSSRA